MITDIIGQRHMEDVTDVQLLLDEQTLTTPTRGRIFVSGEPELPWYYDIVINEELVYESVRIPTVQTALDIFAGTSPEIVDIEDYSLGRAAV